jgi:hypothetical protein
MADGEEFFLAPVRKGMFSMEGLKTGTITLFDILLANEYLMVEVENQYRINEHHAEKNRHG